MGLSDDTGAQRGLPGVFRGPGATTGWIVFVVYLGFAYAFTFVFSRGYESKGILQGVRYALWISVMTSVTYSLAMYAAQPIPFSLALERTLIGIAQLIAYGVVLSLVFGRKGAPRAVQCGASPWRRSQTPCLAVQRQAGRVFPASAPPVNRTRNLLIKSQLLCQLS